MIRVAVCDDNEVMLDFLSREIASNLISHNVQYEMSVFSGGEKFVSQLEANPFDVVFLDIRMPDIDGFEAAKRVRRISGKTHIIFITTESSLVYDSFDYNPFYFIPKGNTDILKLKLKSVIDKLIKQISENYSLCFELPHGEKKYISSDLIVYVTSKSNYIDIITKDELIHIRRKLDDIQNELPQKCFARIHNRNIVNMRYVARIDNTRLKAILKDGTELEISRTYKAAFSEKYNIYMRNFF